MNRLRKQLSSWVVWGMVPLAVWGGTPSTACVCANGRIKLFCSHRCEGGHEHSQPADAESCGTHQQACCCGDSCDDHAASSEAALDGDGGHDCCNSPGGNCQPGSGISSRGCCTPVRSLTTTSSQVVKVAAPVELSLATIPAPACLFHGGHVRGAHSWRQVNTGPPVDLVVTLGHFLI